MSHRKNDIVTLTVEGYTAEGAGVARLDGQVVFVAGALRGETCRVRLEKLGRSAIWGKAVEILSASPARQEPDCPYYPKCGGCSLRHMDYAEELALKRQRVQDAVTRIGGTELEVSAITGSEQVLCYRNKVQFPVQPGADGTPRIGFYRARSHDVVNVTRCLLQPPAADRLRAAVQDWMVRFRVPAYEERTGRGLVRHVYVRVNQAGQSLCCLLINGTSVPHPDELTAALRAAEPGLAGVVLGINQRKSNVILGDRYRTLWGQDYLTDTLCGLEFRLSVPSFFQVNRRQAEVLYGKALDFAALTGAETALDLYCGVGTITSLLAGRAGQVYGAEVVPEAVEDARANARRNGLSNITFLCGDAGEAAEQLAARGVRPDVVTVDPPRKGLSPQVIEVIAGMAPKRLVYVSCDPGTLGRDIARLRGFGYQPVRAEAVDLFPRTPHVETLVLMSRA